MSIANPKPESFDKHAPSLVDESSLDDVDNVNNVGDVVASVVGKSNQPKKISRIRSKK